MSDELICFKCAGTIDKSKGFTEKEVTVWDNEIKGQTFSYPFHSGCEMSV